MQNERFFPKLEEKTVFNVGVVFRQIASDPTYLDDPECPYPSDVREWFRNKTTERSAPPEEERDLEGEAEHLFRELKEIGKGLDGSDRLQWLKASTSLFEKLINLKERAAGVKAIGEFKAAVLEVIENVMTPEQRTLVMDGLNQLL